MVQPAVLRLLDANGNRALEGLRVCEDIVRFHLNTPQAFRRLRALRHAVANSLNQLPVRPSELLRSRASARDIGRDAPSTAVDSLERLLLINFQRVKESLRVLEECVRIIAPRRTANFQALRFRTYVVERNVILRLATLRRH